MWRHYLTQLALCTWKALNINFLACSFFLSPSLLLSSFLPCFFSSLLFFFPSFLTFRFITMERCSGLNILMSILKMSKFRKVRWCAWVYKTSKFSFCPYSFLINSLHLSATQFWMIPRENDQGEENQGFKYSMWTTESILGS